MSIPKAPKAVKPSINEYTNFNHQITNLSFEIIDIVSFYVALYHRFRFEEYLLKLFQNFSERKYAIPQSLYLEINFKSVYNISGL